MLSPKVYYSLSRWFYLPPVSTLHKCVSGLESKPGFNRIIQASIKHLASKLKPNNKKCIISFDEMKLKPDLSYDKKNMTPLLDMKTMVLLKCQIQNFQLMHQFLWCLGCVRNINKWFFFYFFPCQSASSLALRLLLEGIKKFVACGFDPVAVVCYQGANNQRLYITELCITPEAPHFSVKIDDGSMHKIYALLPFIC